MRKLIAWVSMCSLDGLLADEGTRLLAVLLRLARGPAGLKQKIGIYQSAYAHIMGRTTAGGR